MFFREHRSWSVGFDLERPRLKSPLRVQLFINFFKKPKGTSGGCECNWRYRGSNLLDFSAQSLPSNNSPQREKQLEGWDFEQKMQRGNG